jgi:hypothetical protein
MWIWFQGPYRNAVEGGPAPPPPEQPIKFIIWKITRLDGYAPADKIPIISYGQVPEGWAQELPESGPASPLLDGYVYTVSAIPDRGVGPRLCVYLKNGRFRPYKDDGKYPSLCSKD